MAKKMLSARVDEGLLGELEALAEERGVSRTDLVESFLRAGLRPLVVADAESRDPTARAVTPRIEQVRAAVPSLRTGADLMWERQQRLNKRLGWGEKTGP